MAHLLHLF